MKGVSQVVDQYGPYGWNRPFSIRSRSENCISIKGIVCDEGVLPEKLLQTQRMVFFLFDLYVLVE